MDKQTRSYILLGAGLLALVIVIFTVTLPGLKGVRVKEKAHEAEHRKMEQKAREDVMAMQPTETNIDKINVGANGRVLVDSLPLRTAPPQNPFRVAPTSSDRSRGSSVEALDIPSGPAPSMYSGPRLMVPPAPVEAIEPDLPVLKGVVAGKDRLAVVHFGGKTWYAKAGDRIDDQWKVLKIHDESITIVGGSGDEVRVVMKGDQ